MKEILTFPERSYTQEQSYNEEFHGRAFDTLQVSADFNVAVGGAVTPLERGALRLLGSPELVQAQNTLIRAPAEDLWHISALFDGGYPELVAPASIPSGSDALVASFRLKLSRIIPSMMVNGIDVKVFLRGNFGLETALATAASGGNISTVTGTLRGALESTMRNPRTGFPRPRITSAEKELPIVSNDIQHIVRFEQDTWVRGFTFRAIRGSATDSPNSDGLIRGIRAHSQDGRGANDFVRARWRNLRNKTKQLAGWSDADYAKSTGFIFIPTTDEQNPQMGGAKLFRAGDAVTFLIDTASTVENGYTGVSAASGDKVSIVTLAATPVAGTGDVGPQVRKIASPRRARRRARALRA